MRSPICKRLARRSGRDDASICGAVLFAFLCLLGVQIAAAAQKQYPVFTEANLEKAMKDVGTSFAAGRMSLAANDVSAAKSQFVHAREELAVTISFWRDRKKADAIGMLRDALTKLDQLDTALSEQAIDRTVTDALVKRVDEACESCHAVYREQDATMKAYRLRRDSL
jgi:hypothetical protein